MLLLNLTSLAFAALAGTAPSATVQAQHAIVADSVVEAVLTAEQLTNYIAVKKALAPFWKAPNHAELLKTAKATGHSPNIALGQQKMRVGVFDYPKLVKQDTSLAAIFTKNHFAAEQFEVTQVSAMHAVAELAMSEVTKAALPDGSTVLGKNIELVKPLRKDLEAVGVGIQVQQGGGGGGGMGGDLNP